MDELDALLSDLSKAPPPKKPVSDLDALMADLSSPAPAPAPAPAPTLAAAKRNDLDALMADLSKTAPAPAAPAPAPAPASDLDTLMRDLSKPSAASAPAPAAPAPPASDLDAMMRALGGQGSVAPRSTGAAPVNLDSILDGLNKDGPSKGTCGMCMQPIMGQVVSALNTTWHIEHFVCMKCRIPLGTNNFFEKDGKPYCEKDWHELFSPRCAYCNGPLLDKCINAIGKMWHPDHFFCAQCGKGFEKGGFLENSGKPYCEECYFTTFAPKCAGKNCGNSIMDAVVTALGKQWHPDCFVCGQCGKDFTGKSFYEIDGYPYCESDYHARLGSLCGTCNCPIVGRCITAMGKRFHPEHFSCAHCAKQIGDGVFKEQLDKPYCGACHTKLFG